MARNGEQCAKEHATNFEPCICGRARILVSGEKDHLLYWVPVCAYKSTSETQEFFFFTWLPLRRWLLYSSSQDCFLPVSCASLSAAFNAEIQHGALVAWGWFVGCRVQYQGIKEPHEECARNSIYSRPPWRCHKYKIGKTWTLASLPSFLAFLPYQADKITATTNGRRRRALLLQC